MVNDGVSMAGHMYADIFIQGLLEPVCDPQVEKPFQWAPEGISGMDTIVDPLGNGRYDQMDKNPYACHMEYKTSSEDKPKPKSDNIRQVIRQRVVMARKYGITDDQLFNSYIFIIQKSGRNSCKVVGPFLVTPTAEELKTAQDDIDLRVAVYEDIIEEGLQDNPYDHPLLKELRYKTCTRCFPLEAAEATPELENTLGGRDEWEKWIQADSLTKWQAEFKKKVRPLVEAGKTVETDYFLVRFTESGRLYIDPKTLK